MANNKKDITNDVIKIKRTNKNKNIPLNKKQINDSVGTSLRVLQKIQDKENLTLEEIIKKYVK